MASLRGRSWMQILGGVALVATTAGSVGAQQPTHPRTFEVLGVLGRTKVDIESWGGNGSMNEELFASGIVGRYFHPSAKRYQFGVELGWIYYFYYEVDFPPFTLYRDVSATHVGPVMRFPINEKTVVDVGVNLHMFEDFTDFGLSAGLSYKVPIKPELSLPVGVRTTIVLDSDAMLLVIGGTVGLSLRK